MLIFVKKRLGAVTALAASSQASHCQSRWQAPSHITDTSIAGSSINTQAGNKNLNHPSTLPSLAVKRQATLEINEETNFKLLKRAAKIDQLQVEDSDVSDDYDSDRTILD